MEKTLRIILFVTLAAALAAGIDFFRRHFGNDRPADAPAAASPPTPGLRDDWPEEEVFRRAFWRHPTPEDRIVRAVRLEWSDRDDVARWAWFMQLHPGPGLLRDLRDADAFGLMPVSTPRLWLPDDLPAPGWYPARSLDGEFEILQHPVQSLTLLYRPSDNLLFASDHGHGFAPAIPKP